MSRILIIDDEKSPKVVGMMIYPLVGLEGDAKSEQIGNAMDFADDVDTWAKNVKDGLEAIIDGGHWNVMCLDHDMGARVGTEITSFLHQNPQYLPDEVYLISMNPVGKQNMFNDLRYHYAIRQDIRGEFGSVTRLSNHE